MTLKAHHKSSSELFFAYLSITFFFLLIFFEPFVLPVPIRIIPELWILTESRQDTLDQSTSVALLGNKSRNCQIDSFIY
jgi:hypothetical protein